MASSNAWVQNKKFILLNNLGSKHGQLMKFGQFISYYKRKNVVKKFLKNCHLKTSSRPFCVCKELTTNSIGKWNFSSKLLIVDMYKQNYQNLSQLAHRPPQILFTGNSLKIKKGLELASRPHLSYNFLTKNFLL